MKAISANTIRLKEPLFVSDFNSGYILRVDFAHIVTYDDGSCDIKYLNHSFPEFIEEPDTIFTQKQMDNYEVHFINIMRHHMESEGVDDPKELKYLDALRYADQCFKNTGLDIYKYVEKINK